MMIKRRHFLTMLGGITAAPTLSVGLPTTRAAITAATYSRYQYGVAVFQARARASVTALDLVNKVGVTPAQATAMLSEMRSSGIVAPLLSASRGTMRARSAIIPRKSIRQTPAGQLRRNIHNSPRPSKAGKENIKMEKFEKLTGIAAPMPLVNIDTDMIIPKAFLKTIKRSGLGVNLFDEMRYDRDGNEIPDFILNKPQYRNAEILVTGDNFGCGSSREHAPWALKDFGIRVVISTSFADIFFNNCFKNGILPIILPQEHVDLLMKDAGKGSNARMTVDLENQEITSSDGDVIPFEVDAFKKHCLLNGLDDIGLTLKKVQSIDTFENQTNQSRPWV